LAVGGRRERVGASQRQLVGKFARRVMPIRWILLEGFGHQPLDRSGNVAASPVDRRRRVGENALEQRHFVWRLESAGAGEHFVQDETDRPHVGRAADPAFLEQLFRRHIG
jgi:hypothetical protein